MFWQFLQIYKKWANQELPVLTKTNVSLVLIKFNQLRVKMPKNIYAILVGIDEYHPASIPPLPALKGCINDIKAVEAELQESMARDGQWQLTQPLILTDHLATRQGIIEGFTRYLSNVGRDDVVLFYYAGYGSQTKVPGYLGLDPWDKTLVCYDSRTPTSRDLTHQELTYLLSKAAQNNPQVLMILDCCYSSAAIRYLVTDITVRSLPTDLRERTLPSFIFAEDSGITMDQGRYIRLHACQDYELAQEYKGVTGEYRGAFSSFLLQTWQFNHGSISYQDLARTVHSLVSSRIPQQSPQLIVTTPQDLDEPFLGGAVGQRPWYFSLNYNHHQNSWVVDGGTLDGILPSTEDRSIILTVFPVGTHPEHFHQPEIALGEARVTQALPQESQVEIIRGRESLLTNQSYWAAIINLPLPLLKVYLKTPVELVSPYIWLVDEPLDADCHLSAANGFYWITHPADNRPLVDPLPMGTFLVTRRLENIARWYNIVHLSNPTTSSINSNDVKMEVIILSGKLESKSPSEVQVEYTYEDGSWNFPIIQIKLTNHSDRLLYCNVIDLSESYTVDVPFFQDQSCIPLAPGGGTVTSFDNIGFTVPDIYWQQGRTEYKDIFKLMVSTREFDASLLQQDGLSSTINTPDPPDDDWFTKQVTLTVVRPQDAQSVPNYGIASLQNGLVEVQPHPSLKAKINLTTLSQASGDLGTLNLSGRLLYFTSGQGSDPGLSVLELTDIENYQVVTPETPLKLLVNLPLAESEYLLLLASNGELYLPLGNGKIAESGKIDLTIVRLIPTTSIALFLVKFTPRKLPRYPTLAVATLAQNDEVRYQHNLEEIKTLVAAARRILLCIHGITGSTASMLPGFNQAIVNLNEQNLPIKEFYDLVLTYDYDQIYTTIEENARLLGQQIQAVGLGANQSQELHIVADSTGGLVSRWFIERESGNQIVQHLVMLGTPNAGIPWANFSNWLWLSLATVLNQTSTTSENEQVIANLLELWVLKDYVRSYLEPNSDLLQSMANNPDPHVPYTIVSGHSILSTTPEESHRLAQLILGETIDPTFFQQPHDLAVAMASVRSVSNERTPAPKIVQPNPDCSHFAYFSHPSGLEALAKAIQPYVNTPTTISQEALPSLWTVNFTPTEDEKYPQKRNSIIVTIVVLLVIGITGFIFWKRSTQPKPDHSVQKQSMNSRILDVAQGGEPQKGV